MRHLRHPRGCSAVCELVSSFVLFLLLFFQSGAKKLHCLAGRDRRRVFPPIAKLLNHRPHSRFAWPFNLDPPHSLALNVFPLAFHRLIKRNDAILNLVGRAPFFLLASFLISRLLEHFTKTVGVSKLKVKRRRRHLASDVDAHSQGLLVTVCRTLVLDGEKTFDVLLSKSCEHRRQGPFRRDDVPSGIPFFNAISHKLKRLLQKLSVFFPLNHVKRDARLPRCAVLLLFLFPCLAVSGSPVFPVISSRNKPLIL